MDPLQLIVNTTTNRVAVSMRHTGGKLRDLWKPYRLDKIDIDVIPVTESGLAKPVFTPVSWAGDTIDIALGRARRPIIGVFKGKYGANTSAVKLGPAAILQDVQDALNAVTGFPTNGGTVSNPMPQQKESALFFNFSFKDVGIVSLIEIVDEGLFPAAAIEVKRLITGTGSVREVQQVAISEKMIAKAQLATASAANPTAFVVSTVQGGGGGNNETQEFSLAPEPIGGQLRVSHDAPATTKLFDIDGNASALSTAFGDGFEPSDVARQKWRVRWTADQTDHGDLTGDLSHVIKANRYRLTLDLTADSVRSAISAAPGDQLIFTLKHTGSGGNAQTIISEPVGVGFDLLRAATI